MIKEINGDLFLAKEDIIAHGCNCRGGFGSGVAGIMAKKYPEVRNAYFKKFNSEKGWSLGDVQIVKTKDGKIVANCATQYDYLPRNKNHADLNAIKKTLIRLKYYAKENNMTIAMPKIGAGLAGGNWKEIKAIIDSIFQDDEVLIVIYFLE